ncbi:RNA polymerase sigma factor [Neobacillus piezotolerans]|uniref:RNA polymerase sigma factor n=1 Tax=Neobacillus piezotolerans TaxID=2259171 RepID=A0A3D8GWN7_9BACI|nr:RNA polymerase sigma factor [Neobacillus piezotolerans]RDU38855.1 RNA polymerase sigma factor [Neobacillus piezotolerans]
MRELDFEQLYSMHSVKLQQIAYSITRDLHLAEDVVQESFLKAYKKLGTVQDTGKIAAWLCSVTRRTAIDFVRGEKRKRWVPADQTVMEQRISEQGAAESTEKKIEFLALRDEVRGAVFRMGLEYQSVLVLRFDYGLKEDEIASRLNLKSGTVRTRLYRARLHLKKTVLEKQPA